MKICVAGQGAFGQKHLDAIKRIDGVEVSSLIGGNPAGTEAIAKKYGIAHWGHDLAEGIERADAVILATPTQMHREQGEQVMRAGKPDRDSDIRQSPRFGRAGGHIERNRHDCHGRPCPAL